MAKSLNYCALHPKLIMTN